MDFTIKDLVAPQELAVTQSQVAVMVALLFLTHKCLNQALLVVLAAAALVVKQHLVDLEFHSKEIMEAAVTLVAMVLVVVVVHQLLQACVLAVLVLLTLLVELLIPIPLVELVLFLDSMQEAAQELVHTVLVVVVVTAQALAVTLVEVEHKA
jgi:hypothetical protein